MQIFVTSAYPDPEPLNSFLAMAAHGTRHRLAGSLQSADAILFVENSHYHDDVFFSRLKQNEIVRRFRDRTFMYNEHDRPWPLLPGLYCSMAARWFDPSRQIATRYIRLFNMVDVSSSSEDILVSFMGRAGTALRRRIVRLSHPRAAFIDTSDFNAFFAGTDTPNHKKYADVLRRSKFVVCPRGVGTSSIRLFECLHAGRVPIIVSDQWVEPEGPDWSACSIRVPESEIESIPRIAEQAESRWPEMSGAAREVWARYFDDKVYFDRVGDALAVLLSRHACLNSRARRMPSLPEAYWRVRMTVHQLAKIRSGRVTQAP